MAIRRISCLSVALAAGSAQAAFFSFASDSAGNAWTFEGKGPSVKGSGVAASNPITLLIDDDNGPLPTLKVSTEFYPNFSLAYAGSVPLGGGDFAHNYTAKGSFSFINMATYTLIPLLTVSFDNALFTALGNANSWYTTAALQGDNSGNSSVTMTWYGATLAGYGLAQGPLLTSGFSFNLTALNTSGALPYNGGNPGTPLTPNFVPTGEWFAEASFSAIGIVPAPGAGVLLGVGGLAMLRRRRQGCRVPSAGQ